MADNRIADLDATFKRNPFSDDVSVKRQEDAIKQHVDLLLLQGEYAAIGRPYVCAGLRNFLFTEFTSETVSDVKARVTEALRHERRATADSIDVRFDTASKYLSITILFRIVDTDKTFTYETRLKRVI